MALVLLLCAVPASVFATPGENTAAANTVIASGEYGAEGGNATWTLDDSGLLQISGSGSMADYELYADVPWDAFRSQVEQVVIEEGITYICAYAFSDCESLTSVTIPASVTAISGLGFNECYSLTEIIVDEANPNYSNDAHGVLYDKEKTRLLQVPGAISGSYSIPDNVTAIDDMAFIFCESLTSVTIPDSVTTICERAFRSCASLTSVSIPDSVTAIGDWAFNDCGSLTDIYYDGTEAQWGRISIGSGNDPLAGATIHYSGTGTEPEELAGDADGSGSVDSDDAIHLLYHTLFGDGLYPVSGDCDFDGSGAVNSDDAVYLLYHTLFGEALYPLN